ncbi:MAG: BrnT family toxin [Alphaproteobacteria bacterium]|nr:MAG: BrnT family toxin [Alphaproteobacteria bacterium]
MHNDEFEWDDAKARENLKKHGIRFETACEVFRDPFAIELLDDRFDYGEERYILIGNSTAGVLTVVHTERGDLVRIISARCAEPNEKRFYHDQKI